VSGSDSYPDQCLAQDESAGLSRLSKRHVRTINAGIHLIDHHQRSSSSSGFDFLRGTSKK
jgi:hypothetical protein